MAYTEITNPRNTALNCVRWTGNSTSRTIANVGFNPDLSIIKLYTGNNEGWYWMDKCRGVQKYLATHNNSAQGTDANSITAWNSDGFTIGTSDGINGSGGRAYVSWHFKGGGDGVANTVGDTDSLVSANTTSGFSVVTWTGTGSNTTVGHGLGAVPKWILVKRTDSSGDWELMPTVLGGTASKFIKVNTTGAEYDGADYMNSTAPTTTVLSLGTHASHNASGGTYVAYCFVHKKGFSWFPPQVGGNGSSDGRFYYTGFRPSIVIIKGNHSSYATSWYWYGDNNRGVGNPVDAGLYPNLNHAGFNNAAATSVKFFCNGFKVTGDDADINSNATWKLTGAFASAPMISTGGYCANAFGMGGVNEG